MVLIFADQANSQIKKAAFEALCYGSKIAAAMGTTAHAIVFGEVNNADDQLASLGKYGVVKVHYDAAHDIEHFDAQVFTESIAALVQKVGATVVVFTNNTSGKAIAPCLSAKLKAGLVTGAIAMPDTSDGFVVKKNVFSGKAHANISINTAIRIITLSPNSFGVFAGEGKAAIEPFSPAAPLSKTKVIEVNKVTGTVPLGEAELVVSGGRGLRGPENWGLVEDLAKALGAATACSRPVADAHWRPHHEHVGQTGGAIAPNLYVAIGISGAIQHLAGVNRSKTIVVINKDAEAPFFKAADYGIVGDAFEVVPKLTEAVKKLKGIS